MEIGVEEASNINAVDIYLFIYFLLRKEGLWQREENLYCEYNFGHLELCLFCGYSYQLLTSLLMLCFCPLHRFNNSKFAQIGTPSFNIYFLTWHGTCQFSLIYGRRYNTLKQGEMYENLVRSKQKYWPLWDKYVNNPYFVFSSNIWGYSLFCNMLKYHTKPGIDT